MIIHNKHNASTKSTCSIIFIIINIMIIIFIFIFILLFLLCVCNIDIVIDIVLSTAILCCAFANTYF